MPTQLCCVSHSSHASLQPIPQHFVLTSLAVPAPGRTAAKRAKPTAETEPIPSREQSSREASFPRGSAPVCPALLPLLVPYQPARSDTMVLRCAHTSLLHTSASGGLRSPIAARRRLPASASSPSPRRRPCRAPSAPSRRGSPFPRGWFALAFRPSPLQGSLSPRADFKCPSAPAFHFHRA